MQAGLAQIALLTTIGGLWGAGSTETCYKPHRGGENPEKHQPASSRKIREMKKAFERAIRQSNKSKAKKTKKLIDEERGGSGRPGLAQEPPDVGRIVDELMNDDCE